MALTRQQVAAHLLRRVGFGGNPGELADFATFDHTTAVDRLLNYQDADNSALDAILAREGAALDPAKIQDVQYYWLLRMIYTNRPLEEKMTLFWHNHFATGYDKVKDAVAMQRQNNLFRQHALDNFDVIVKAVARDPAMLRWLDSNTNRKGSPNENWARELFELFTLGIGNYSEQDVKESARAFTGWFERMGAFYFNKAQHDGGNKTVLGQSGTLNGDDVIDIALRQPAAGRFLAHKLITFFVTDQPSEGFVSSISKVYFDSQYSVRAMVQAILSSDEFQSEANYRAQVKSPADYLVGMVKSLGVSNPNKMLAIAMRQMGMDLYNPPSVKGWDWGTDWVSTNTYFARANIANSILSQRDKGKPLYTDILGLLHNNNASNGGDATNYLLGLLTDDNVSDGVRQKLRDYASNVDLSQTNADADGKARGLTHLVVASPAYQLN